MEYLKVRDFGPISNLEVTLKKINVFIGEQGVGKSTLAKLLSCCRDYVLYYYILNEGRQDEVMAIFSMYGIHDYFKESTYIEYNAPASFHLIFQDGTFDISHATVPKEDLNDFVSKLLLMGIEGACNTLGTPIKEFNQEGLQKILRDKQVIFANLRRSLYCPAERGILSALSASLANILLAKIPLPRPLFEYMSFFEKARQEYPYFKIPFLDLSYKFEKGEDVVTVNGASVKLKYASSGIQSILPLMMVIEYCSQNDFFSSFTIEEPELHLFPTNQFHLLQALILKTNNVDNDNKLENWTITTHSPYLLSVFNISLLAGKIAEKFPDAKELSEIISPEYIIRPGEIAAYELANANDTSSCCKSIIDDKTDLIKGSYLDSVSDVISADFHRLYRLYIKLTRETQ